MKCWISKYALTQGIFSVEATTCERTGSPDMIVTTGKGLPAYYHTGDWHRTMEDAVARAEKIRAKKIQSIKKQLARIEGLSWEVLPAVPSQDQPK